MVLYRLDPHRMHSPEEFQVTIFHFCAADSRMEGNASRTRCVFEEAVIPLKHAHDNNLFFAIIYI